MSKRPYRIVGKQIADQYCITGEIGKGGMGVVYRAIPFDDPSHAVAIKVIQRSGKFAYDDLMRFQKEASLMSQLHHTNIVVFHELGLFGDKKDESSPLGSGYYIVMEIADGLTLKKNLERDGRKDLAFFFQIGLQVSAALDYTHGKNIIHRDIKPQNIIVGQAFRDQRGILVKVLDFGVARLAEAMQYMGDKDTKGFEDIAGTPIYMAPEQTRLMDAPIDHRVDLYSLGCVLYEILTGKPPFSANSREKLEKQHVFAEPEALTNLRPDVPEIIEHIIHKLLAKHPKDRYQTAFSLHADLNRAKTYFEKSGSPTGIHFPLGLRDSFQAVSLQINTIGRTNELNQLTTAFESVAKANGRSHVSLISAHAGMGKTKILNELRSYFQNRKVKFISGTFSQHENALPFNALANAFNEYLFRILKSHPYDAEELRRKVRQTCGEMAYQIAEIVPGLRPFLDYDEIDTESTEEPLCDFSKPEHFSKFAKAFSDFTRCLSTKGQPIVFLFDDMHWADEKSINLIDQFFSNANTLQFYLVMSERPNPLIANPEFENFKRKFQNLKRRYLEVFLPPLDEGSVDKICNHMLSSQTSIDTELIRHLYDVTKGNPMHLVEYTRALVAEDLIFPKNRQREWGFDLNMIRAAKIRLSTVDLALSKIQNFAVADREILEIAATAGLTFQFETLLLKDNIPAINAMKSIRRAMDEGLILRITDDNELRHLGKTYVFSHKKARDAIYEQISPDKKASLHLAIAAKIENSVENPTEKIIFALAHHYNSGLERISTPSKVVIQKTLYYNSVSGEAAYKNGSLHTAERYFEKAIQLIERMPEIATTEEKAKVIETLADVVAVQKAHGKAIKIYRSLLREKLPKSRLAHLAYKTIHYQLIGGIQSDSINLTKNTLKKFHLHTPKIGVKSGLVFVLSILRDVLFTKTRFSYAKKALHIAAKNRNNITESTTSAALKLYNLGPALYQRDNYPLALLYLQDAYLIAHKSQAHSQDIVRAVADRSFFLSILGLNKIAYVNFDLCMEVAKACNLKYAFGYTALQRLLSIDYLKNRNDEINENLHYALKYISPNEDRLSYGLAIQFKAFKELMRCHFSSLYASANNVPDLIPTRNWLTPRVFSLMLFGYLLQGSRAKIVRHGEMFLKRRKLVAGRNQDIFIRIIKAIIGFARGDADRSKENYMLVIEEFIHSKHNEFYYPFEKDFIGLFSVIMPDLYATEFGHTIISEKYISTNFPKVNAKIKSKFTGYRPITFLIEARISEALAKHKSVKSLYDQALRDSKASGNNLVQIFAYAWFGAYLSKRGQSRKEYIRRSFIMSTKLEMHGVSRHLKKLTENFGLKIKEVEQLTATESMYGSIEHNDTLSPFSIDHLSHVISAVESDAELRKDIQKSFSILRKFYSFERAEVIFTGHEDEQPRVIYPEAHTRDVCRLLDYINPYINLRSSLYLPMHDAPWNTHAEASSTTNDFSPLGSQATEEFSQSETMELNHTQTRSLNSMELNSTEVLSTRVQSSDPSATPLTANRKLKMSVLVPLRSDFDTIGVIYMEDIKSLSKRDSAFSRYELDNFGAQLAILLERKIDFNVTKRDASEIVLPAKTIYRPATYTLEKLPWIKMWNRGRLRIQRETSWYLGLAINEDAYMLTYCNLTGDEYVREKLSSLLWHQVQITRSQLAAAGHSRVEILDLSEEFRKLLASFPKASQLDGLSFAVSLFDRNEKRVVSGHFGPSRPLVIGVENLVTPSNDIVLQLQNGRDMRFWSVEATSDSPHAYILSYDTSKLDAAPADTTQKEVANSLVTTDNEEDLHKILCTLAPAENLPRYYVAAIIEPEQFKLPTLEKGA